MGLGWRQNVFFQTPWGEEQEGQGAQEGSPTPDDTWRGRRIVESYTIGPVSADRSEGLPIQNRQFPIENPVVRVESGVCLWFGDYFCEGLPIKNRQFPIENPVVVVDSEDFRGFWMEIEDLGTMWERPDFYPCCPYRLAEIYPSAPSLSSHLSFHLLFFPTLQIFGTNSLQLFDPPNPKYRSRFRHLLSFQFIWLP